MDRLHYFNHSFSDGAVKYYETKFAQSAGDVEYTDCTSAEG